MEASPRIRVEGDKEKYVKWINWVLGLAILVVVSVVAYVLALRIEVEAFGHTTQASDGNHRFFTPIS